MKPGKIIAVFLILISVVALFFVSYIFYLDIVKPSILSVKSACNLISDEELNSQGYYLSGFYNLSTDEVVVLYEDPKINKHELIHQYQYYSGNLKDCSNKIGLFFNEIEAYTFQELPDDKFYIRYNISELGC